MDENGSTQPVFETDEENSYFVATLPIHSQATSGATSGVLTPILTPEVREFLNDKAIDLLDYCLTPRSRTEIQMRLQVKDAKHVRERYIYPLLSAKLILMTDPEHPQSPNQRFKTTKFGSNALAEYEGKFGKLLNFTLFDSLD